MEGAPAVNSQPLHSSVVNRLLSLGGGSWTGATGLLLLLMIAVPCFVTLPWSADPDRYRETDSANAYAPPTSAEPFGSDSLGRSMLWRTLLGGAISLSIGISAAVISVAIGVGWGAISGYIGGRTDATMMRVVDILYGLPYILLVVLMAVAVDGVVSGYMNRQFQQRDSIEQQKLVLVAAAEAARNEQRIVDAEKIEAQVSQLTYEKTALMNLVEDYPWVINLFTLIIAIGGVSWLTMARVIRGQVLSLRSQPFVEAARALGVGPWRILRIHLLPNLIGPIVVYTTLTVPSAILQESFLSFLGIGVQPPMPSWGNLASDGLPEVHSVLNPDEDSRWWLLFWPCFLLGLTLMALNFLGDALRSRIDPKSRKNATA